MRTLLILACLGLGSSCLTADATCDSVALGAPVPLAAKPAGEFCTRGPAGRHRVAVDGGPNCSEADGGCEVFSFGEVFEEGSYDSAQCCLGVKDGVVVEKVVRFTY